MRYTMSVPLLLAALLVAFAVGPAAAAAVNGSKSNNLKTAADCTKAGGKWGEGREGLGCYVASTTKPAAASDKPKSGK